MKPSTMQFMHQISSLKIVMKEISLKNLKEYLKQRSKEDLINEIPGLFTRFEYVKLKIPLILAGDSMMGLVICITNALRHNMCLLLITLDIEMSPILWHAIDRSMISH